MKVNIDEMVMSNGHEEMRRAMQVGRMMRYEVLKGRNAMGMRDIGVQGIV